MQVQEEKGADRGWFEIQSSLTWHFTPSLLSTYCMPGYDLWYKSLLAGENQLDGDWWGGGTPALIKVRDKASLTWASGSASGETYMDSRQILEFELTGLANGLDIRCERRGSLEWSSGWFTTVLFFKYLFVFDSAGSLLLHGVFL